MAQTTPPTIDPAPSPAPQRSDRITFSGRLDAFVTWIIAAVAQFAALALNVYNNALDAFNSATSAAGSATAAASSAAVAATASGAVAFNPATSYANGQAAISNVNRQSYRRKSAGNSATDPALDPTNWDPSIFGVGAGGATPSASTVLTATSGGAQSITTTDYGQSVQLPDATTCQKGASVFTLRNSGAYPLRLLNSAGTLLGFVPPFQTVLVGLANNSTAAGAWLLNGHDYAGVTAVALRNNPASIIQSVAIDATRWFLLSYNNSSAIYGTVYDSSSNTFGSTVLIRTGVSLVNGFASAGLIAANQILVASSDNGGALQGVALSISGTSITVNTAASVSVGTTVSGPGFMIVLGSTAVINYSKTTPTGWLRAMTVSGTTVTIGAELAITPTYLEGLYADSGTVGLAIGGNAANAYAQPFTVSGTTITLGTAASWVNTQQVAAVACRKIGSRYMRLTSNSYLSGLISVSGTTATVSTFTSNFGASDLSSGYLADAQISSTKWLLVGATSAAIVTDSAGTASISSLAMGVASFGSSFGLMITAISASRASVYGVAGAGSVNGSGGSDYQFVTVDLDVSAATPVVLSANGYEPLIPTTSVGSAPGAASMSNILSHPRMNYSGAKAGAASSSWFTPNMMNGGMQAMGLNSSMPILLGGLLAPHFPGNGQMVPRPVPSVPFYPRTGHMDESNSLLNDLNSFHLSDRRMISFAGGGMGAGTTKIMYVVECAA
jgi:hypothetical protein